MQRIPLIAFKDRFWNTCTVMRLTLISDNNVTLCSEFLFKTEFRFLIPCLRHLTRNHTLCKTIVNIGTLSYSIDNQNYLQLDQQSHEELFTRKDTLFKTKIDKIDTPFKTKND